MNRPRHRAPSCMATGSEVGVAMSAAAELERDGVPTRVVSMPSWELFAAQPKSVSRPGAATCHHRARRDRGREPVRLGALGRRPRHASSPCAPSVPRRRPSASSSSSVSPQPPPPPPSGTSSPGAMHERQSIRDRESAGGAEPPGPEPLVRLHHPRPGALGRAGAPDPRGRPQGHDVEPDDLREGGRDQHALRRRHPAAGRPGQEPGRDLRGAGGGRRAGGV